MRKEIKQREGWNWEVVKNGTVWTNGPDGKRLTLDPKMIKKLEKKMRAMLKFSSQDK